MIRIKISLSRPFRIPLTHMKRQGCYVLKNINVYHQLYNINYTFWLVILSDSEESRLIINEYMDWLRRYFVVFASLRMTPY